MKNNFVLIYELLDGKPGPLADMELELITTRNHGLWISSELGNRHIKDVHHDGEREIGNGSGGFISP